MFQLKIDDNLQLVLLTPRLAQEVYELIDLNREFLSVWLPFPPLTKSVDDTLNFIEKSVSGFGEGNAMHVGIREGQQLVGVIGLNKIFKSFKKADLGYWLAEEHQGKGIIHRSCQAMFQYAFEELGMQKVEIRAASENYRSRRVCEKLNLPLEGIITHSGNLHGKIMHFAVYACHYKDWKN